jgi:hypothetical protein
LLPAGKLRYSLPSCPEHLWGVLPFSAVEKALLNEVRNIMMKLVFPVGRVFLLSKKAAGTP